MIDHLAAWKPTDTNDWLLELPRPLAAGTDGDQFARFAPAIIALVARHVQMAGGSPALTLRR